MNHFDVAAGILCDSSGRVLIAERLGGGPFHGLWEFPGGKIDVHESALEALYRELAEELGIEVTACTSFMNLRHEYDDRIVTIEFFLVSAWRSDPMGREGQALRWVRKEKLDAEELLPADLPVVSALQQIDN
ncbi:MAG: 8-oxo-dGTP diphosphatase MutT [Gammaproteobacteria bacterium]|nr:8-oxo-dGTP diphosphatase MutT [Gammaproteobacteria bacterium]NNC56617.1 8-oxo-dGTP diphosphatase MutT [Woeseiaceae bacterium]